MLQKTNDRVLICLPDGRWLALSAELFREALQNGAELAAPPIGSPARETSSALVTVIEVQAHVHPGHFLLPDPLSTLLELRRRQLPHQFAVERDVLVLFSEKVTTDDSTRCHGAPGTEGGAFSAVYASALNALYLQGRNLAVSFRSSIHFRCSSTESADNPSGLTSRAADSPRSCPGASHFGGTNRA